MPNKHLKRRWIDRRVYEYFAVNVAPYLGWNNPILVYQMGKVGSSSIRNSLFRSRDPSTRLVLMSHEFYPLRDRDLTRIKIEPELMSHVVDEVEHDRRVQQGFSAKLRRAWRRRERFYSQRIYQAYVKPGGPLRVITLVREPIANNASMFFELFEHYGDAPADCSDLTIEQMVELFLNQYMHWRPLTWLDAELKTTLGVDVYQYPFSPQEGYAVIRERNIQLLVLRVELDDRRKENAIKEFLGLESFELVRSNVTSNRAHARVYRSFLDSICVPTWLLDEMYESKYAKHFYSDAERSTFRQRWGGSEST